MYLSMLNHLGNFMNIQIRPIDQKDLFTVRSILNDVILNKDSYLSDSTKSEKDILDWYYEHLNSNLYSIDVVEVDGELAGWVSLSSFRSIDGYNSTAELSVYVNPQFYRQGIASFMMDHIEQKSKMNPHIYKIISVITSTNEASIALHEKRGYETEGFFRKIAQKNGKLHDVLFMTKNV